MSSPQSLNFFRQAAPWLEHLGQRLEAKYPKYAQTARALLHDAPATVKFVLPDDGLIFDDGFKGVPDDFRLPYPAILLEFYCTYKETGQKGKVIVYAYQRDKSILILCLENNTGKNGKERWDLMPFVAECMAMGEAGELDNAVTMQVLEEKNLTLDTARRIPQAAVRHWDMGPITIDAFGDKWKALAYTSMSPAQSAVFSLIEALSCSNVGSEPLPVRKANKGALKRGVLPFDEYRVLTVRPGHGSSSADGDIHLGATGRSPREHLRRGHIRRLQNGKKIWVNAHVVNAGAQGKLHKTYNITAPVAQT